MTAKWNEDARRWYVDGEPVHAGTRLEIQGRTHHYDSDGNCETKPAGWISVRIESRDRGHVLDAYATIEGLTFVHRTIADFGPDGPRAHYPMRWPR